MVCNCWKILVQQNYQVAPTHKLTFSAKVLHSKMKFDVFVCFVPILLLGDLINSFDNWVYLM